MKTFKLILLTALFLVACSNSKTPQLQETIEKPSSLPILEITSDFIGPWWMNGKVLDFRLYDDATAEYDEYPLLQSNIDILKSDEIKVAKRIKLNEAEFNYVTKLLSNNNLTNAKMKHRGSCTDAIINTNIDFISENTEKHIQIESYCTQLSDIKSVNEHFSQFSSSIVELFKTIKEIKNKESAGKFFN